MEGKVEKQASLCFSSVSIFCYLYGYQKMRLVTPEEVQDIIGNGQNATEDKILSSDRQRSSQVTAHRLSILSKQRSIRIPDEISLCISSLPGSRFGACAVKKIPAGTWFGPFEGKLVRRDRTLSGETSEYMWEIFHDGEVSHFLDGQEEKSWMSFVRCARHKREQNMVVFQYHGCIYYRTTKEVQPATELLVWYDNKYSQLLGLPLSWNDTRAINTKRKPSFSPPNEAAKKRRGRTFSDTKMGEPGIIVGSTMPAPYMGIHAQSRPNEPTKTEVPSPKRFLPSDIKVINPRVFPKHFEDQRHKLLESWNGFTCGKCLFTFQTKESYETHGCRQGRHVNPNIYPPMLTNAMLEQSHYRPPPQFQSGPPYCPDGLPVRALYPRPVQIKSTNSPQGVHRHRFPVPI